jgi:hypothetical protein
MSRRWPDILTIVGAIVLPMMVHAISLVLEQSARTESARNVADTVGTIALLVVSVLLLAWAIARVVRGASRGWQGRGLRLAALIVVVLCSPLMCGGWIAYLPMHFLLKVGPEQKRLLHETNHEAVAQACAAIMRDYKHYEGRRWDDPLIPTPIRDIRPSSLEVDENGVTMEMHGGFDHYGLRFCRDSGNKWELQYYTEGGSRTLVSGVVLEKEPSSTR